MNTCKCCGKPGMHLSVRVDGGRMHFNCWEEHHSDPSGEWPRGHKCFMEGV